MKRKYKFNPILHNIDGVKYVLTDQPNYDDSLIIKNFVKILNNKFPKFKKYLPIFNFIDLGRGELGFYENNEIQINSKIYWDKNDYFKYLHTLFHELAHCIWEKYLSNSTKNLFISHIKKYSKYLSIKALNKILEKYSEEEIKIKFPLIYVLINSVVETEDFGIWLQESTFNYSLKKYFHKLLQKKSHIKLFIKPVTSYMPDTKYYYEEIFCEMFANYMMYGRKGLQNENYLILKTILPELN